ncbi:MAG: glycosyltransferase family 4 protein [Fretibacterium sp.]|nr:glycosyltransferase family 4 protein [Fretibacterium sp.]
MIRRLAPDFALSGTASWVGHLRPGYVPSEYARFHFPIGLARLPDWLLYDFAASTKHRFVRRLIRPFFHGDYNFLARDNDSDVFIFFSNHVPDFPIRGKVITCLHDILSLHTESGEFVAIYKKFLKNVMDKSTKIITDSEFSKQDIIDYTHIDESRIEVVYCGVNAEEFAAPCPAPENVRAKYNLPEKYILYFGTCGPRKNVESVVRVYARLPEATRHEYALVITNPSDAVKACAAENNVTPHYISGVRTEDKPAVYQMASVLVWLSVYEGFGLPIVEAQAAGTPVVCSNVTSLPEVAGDAAVLVGPMDTEAAAAAIERCLYDAPFRQDLTAKGRENIKRFSWDNAAEKLHDIIINL